MRIAHASIVSAFGPRAIGTRVLNVPAFNAALTEAVASFDFAGQRVPGQGFIPLPDATRSLVSAGVGPRVDDPAAFVLRSYRGEVRAFLSRERAAEVTGVAVVVDTLAAYLQDPDVAGDPAKGIPADPAEAARVIAVGATHVLVCVLAFAGPRAPFSRDALLHNLAGGNNEANAWSADEIRAHAAATEAYAKVWATVAD
jgi:hypothetical protein